VAFLAFKRRGARDVDDDGSVTASHVLLAPVRRVDIAFLALASAYAFVVPFTRTLAWYDSVVLLGLFAVYLWRVSLEEQSEPELIGVSDVLGRLPTRRRRVVVPGLFLVAAVIVLVSAEPFANGLVATGERLGIDQFLLVQWLAPLASEAPELIVVSLFALRLRGGDALGTLLSSKVNQWTLLVGSLPIAYMIGGGGHGLHLDTRQTEEFFLTSAQALLALMVLIDLRFSRRDAALLLGLFVAQFPFPQTGVRLAFSVAYLVAAAAIGFRHRRAIVPTFATMLRRPSRSVPALHAPGEHAE
jgi:cation:H+ antiporter